MPHPHLRWVGRRIVGPALLAGLAAAGLYAWLGPAPAPDTTASSEAFPWARTPGASPPAQAQAPQLRADGADSGDLAVAGPTGAGLSTDPLAANDDRPRPFRVDGHGRLIVDRAMRLHIDSLLGLNDGATMAGALDAELNRLPAAAAARARELLGQYQAYQDAQRQSFPPGQAPLAPEEGLAQLSALQALRTTYLGAEASQQMFAQDDAVTRRLLELMREDTATTLTMAEKAMRAQARYDSERNRVQP